MEKFNIYIQKQISDGYLCTHCTDIANNANSKKDFMDMVLSAGGISWLLEMQFKNREMPYEIMRDYFKDYINGRYIASFPNCNNSKTYTGTLYMDITDRLDVVTNYVTLFNCKCDVYIPENTVVSMCIDKNCDIKIYCPPSSKCKIDSYGRAISNTSNVRIVNYK